VRNAVGDASKGPTGAPHPSVAHHDQIRVDLIGDTQNRSRGIVRERVCEVLSRVTRRDRFHRSFGVSPTGALRARIRSAERDHEVEVGVELLGDARPLDARLPGRCRLSRHQPQFVRTYPVSRLRSALIRPVPLSSCVRDAGEADVKTAPAETGATSERLVFGALRQVSNSGRGSRRTESSVR
jgi:hypothetical protein